MVEAEEDPAAAQRASSKQRCRACGRLVEKTYQNNTCKGCLVDSFGKYIKMIDHYRDLRP